MGISRPAWPGDEGRANQGYPNKNHLQKGQAAAANGAFAATGALASADAFAAPGALSVSEALAYVKHNLEAINIQISGEVSELSDRPGYKAVYFTISDQSSALSCLIWKNVYDRLGVELKIGMQVEVGGRFTLYAAKGRMNFEVKTIKLSGEGELRVKVAQLARRLEAEGLMAPGRKRAVPRFCERIGLVTSPRGKAVHDVLRTLRRRWPLAKIELAGVAVEGNGAAEQMAQALACLEEAGCPVILLVRGGGSYEDLMPFNDERLARAIAASPAVIVTGIGHEPDTSIADLVADYRASTPTAAAERVSPEALDLKAALERESGHVAALLQQGVSQKRQQLLRISAHPLFGDPQYLLGSRMLALEHAQARLRLRSRELLRPLAQQLAREAGRLEALSPLSTLARGYALPFDGQRRLLRSVQAVAEDDRLSLLLADGSLDCRVERVLRGAEARGLRRGERDEGTVTKG
ncbi:MAG: exodeoxyribonuclease VII large subunit [Coriobacteriia bacterium]|nr:exodeoxyribonuclease VII large subunit [Coriobacteriia bacterium]